MFMYPKCHNLVFRGLTTQILSPNSSYNYQTINHLLQLLGSKTIMAFFLTTCYWGMNIIQHSREINFIFHQVHMQGEKQICSLKLYLWSMTSLNFCNKSDTRRNVVVFRATSYVKVFLGGGAYYNQTTSHVITISKH